MLNRRDLLIGAAGLMAAQSGFHISPGLAAEPTYEEAAAELRAPLRGTDIRRELVRFASLAANSHNTQPWKFKIADDAIEIIPDLTRRCPAVDPDDHHLFVSLGCAVENLVLAATTIGLHAEPAFTSATDRIRIALTSAPPRPSALADAIPRRQSTRSPYDGSQVLAGQVRMLEDACRGQGASAIMITDRARMDNVLDYVVQGNTTQMRDPAFVDELRSWIRFSDAQALATRDGLSARASGNPNVPAWLAKLLFPFVFTERGENDKYRDQIRSSAGIAVLVSEQDDKPHWVETGRACQRFGLRATALGLKYAFINQPVESSALRRQFADFLGLGSRRPDLIMRFGRGPALPFSLRRPVTQITT